MRYPVHLVSGFIGAGPAPVEDDPAVQDEVDAALVMAGYGGLEWLTAFQADQGLPVTGAFDPETLDRLGAVIIR